MPDRSGARAAWIAALLDAGRTDLRVTFPQTLLARAKGFVGHWRSHDEHLLIFLLGGDAIIDTPASTLRLGRGDCVWIPAGLRHRLRQPRLRTQYRLRFKLLASGAQVPLPGGPWASHVAWHLRPLFEMAHTEHLRAGPECALRWRCLLALLCSHLAEPTPDTTPPRAATGTLSAAQRTAVEQRWAGWRTMGVPSPRQLARAAGLGHDWFTRAFRRTFAVPPRRWIADRRLDTAANALVASDDPASVIAANLDWSHYAQFARQFRERFGATPERWRQERVPPQRGRNDG